MSLSFAKYKTDISRGGGGRGGRGGFGGDRGGRGFDRGGRGGLLLIRDLLMFILICAFVLFSVNI